MQNNLSLLTIVSLAFIACSLQAMDDTEKMLQDAAAKRKLMLDLMKDLPDQAHSTSTEIPKVYHIETPDGTVHVPQLHPSVIHARNNTNPADWNRIDGYGRNLNTDLLYNNQ